MIYLPDNERRKKSPEKYEDYKRELRERYKNDLEYRMKIKEQCKNYFRKNKETIRIYKRGWCAKNKKRNREYHKEYCENLRFSILAVLSDGQPKCSCCSENKVEFLTIDHIDRKGIKYGKNKDLKTIQQFFLWLIHNNFPEGYRVLCYNCNCSLGHYGYCPHNFTFKIEQSL